MARKGTGGGSGLRHHRDPITIAHKALFPTGHPFEFVPPTRPQRIGRKLAADRMQAQQREARATGIPRTAAGKRRAAQARLEIARRHGGVIPPSEYGKLQAIGAMPRTVYKRPTGAAGYVARSIGGGLFPIYAQHIHDQVRAGKLTPSQGARLLHLEQAQIGSLVSGNFGQKLATGAIQAALGAPLIPILAGHAGYESIKHRSAAPLYHELGQPIAHSVAESFTHPLRNPFNTLATGAMAFGGISGLAGRSAALRAGAESQAGRGALARAVLTPVPKSRTLGIPSRNYLFNEFLRHVDAAKMKRMGEPSVAQDMPGVRGAAGRALETAFSPQAKQGRLLRRGRDIEHSIQLTPALQLERYGHTIPAEVARRVTRFQGGALRPHGKQLGATELKAGDIMRLPTTTAEEHILASTRLAEQTRAEIEQLQAELPHLQGRDRADVAHEIQRLQHEHANHIADVRLAQAAVEHVRNPSPHLQEALRLARRANMQAERWKGLPHETLLHRLGEESLQIKALAAGHPDPLLERTRMEYQLEQAKAELGSLRGRGKPGGLALGAKNPLEKVGERDARMSLEGEIKHLTGRLEALKQDFIKEGARVRQQGGFYVSGRPLTKLTGPPTPRRAAPLTGLRPPAMPKVRRFEGAARRAGIQRSDFVQATAEDFRQAHATMAKQELFRQGLRMAKTDKDKAGGDAWAIPVFDTNAMPKDVKTEMATPSRGPIRSSELEVLGPDGPMIVNRADLGRLKLKWVDRRRLGIERSGVNDSWGGKVVDAVNAFARAGILFGQGPKYIVNLPQNALTAAFHQGVFLPANIKRFFSFSKDTQDEITSVLGAHGRSQALAPESGLGKKVLERTANWWNRVTDQDLRNAAFVHQARIHGFHTEAQIKSLLHDSRWAKKRQEIITRADNEMVPFLGQSAVERSVKRGFFFYPWARGATLWTTRLPVEHGVQLGLETPLAQEAYKKFAAKHVPSWMQGTVNVGGWGYNPRALNTPETLVELGRAASGLVRGNSPYATGALGNITPAYGAIIGALTGTNTLGQTRPAGVSPISWGARQLIGAAPLAQDIQRITKKGGLIQGGWEATVRAALGGQVAGFRYDKKKAATLLEKEVLGGKSQVGRISYKRDQALRQLHSLAGQYHMDAAVPEIEHAITLSHAREIALAGVARKLHKKVSDLSSAQRFATEARVLRRFGIGIPDATITQMWQVQKQPGGKQAVESAATSIWSGISGPVGEWRKILDLHNIKYVGYGG